VETSERVNKAREFSTISIEDRIERVRHGLGFDGKQDPQLKALTRRVAALEKKLNALMDASKPRTAKKSASKKKTTRKTKSKKA
jgi:hypothetical protein